MIEWYYADGQQRQGPLPAEDMRLRFQRGEITLTTLVWREGFAQWKPLSEAVDELQLQNLANTAATLGGGIDLRGDYTAIDNGTAPLPGTGGGIHSPYTAPAASAGYASAAVVGGNEVVYAGFWKRFAAYFIDAMLIGVVTTPLSMILNVFAASSGNEGVAVAGALVVMLISIVINIGYYAGFHASRGGATLGKMAVGIKVVRSTGERISFLRAVCRYLATILSSLILMIGFIMAAFTERKQGLHDMICDTLVVDKWAFTENPGLQQRGLGTVTVVILVLAGVGMLALFGLMIAMVGVAASMAS